jgi:hypothetical protein
MEDQMEEMNAYSFLQLVGPKNKHPEAPGSQPHNVKICEVVHAPKIRLFSFQKTLYGYGSIPINTIFSGMNIHLPAILGFTTVTGF